MSGIKVWYRSCCIINVFFLNFWGTKTIDSSGTWTWDLLNTGPLLNYSYPAPYWWSLYFISLLWEHGLFEHFVNEQTEDNRSVKMVKIKDSEHCISHLCGYRVKWSVVAERSSLPDSSSGVSSRMWVRIPAVTLVSLSKTLNHNCFSPPRG